MIPLKKCSLCNQVKDDFEFYVDKSQKSGLSCRCKSCIQQWRKDHSESIKVSRRKHYTANKDKL